MLSLKDISIAFSSLNKTPMTLAGGAAAAAKSRQLCPTLRDPGLQPTRLLHPWDFPGKSTGVGAMPSPQM